MNDLSTDRALRVAACLIAGFACIQACKWIMLSSGTAFTPSMVYLSRFSGVGTMGLSAILFFNRLPNPRRMLLIAIGMVLGYALFTALGTLVLPDSLHLIVLHVAVALYGVADGLFILMFLQLIALFEPKKSAVLIVATELLTNVLMILLGAISGFILVVIRFSLLIVGIMLYVVALSALQKDGQLDAPGISATPEESNAAPDNGSTRSDFSGQPAFPHTLAQWALLIIFAAALFNIFGLVAQISSMTGDSFALYDTPTGIAMVLLDALLLAYMLIRGSDIHFKTIAVLCGSLYVLSLVIYNYSWTTGSVAAGILLRGGYDIAWVLLTAMVAQKVYEQPRKSYAYFGIFRALTTLYPGRLLGTMLLAQVLNQNAVVATTTQVLILVIFALVVLVFVLQDSTASRQGDKPAPAGDDDEGTATQNAAAASRSQLDAWADTVGLTEREREILDDLMKGYTRNVIAERNFVSPATVKSHVSHIYAKAGVSSKQELLQLIGEDLPER